MSMLPAKISRLTRALSRTPLFTIVTVLTLAIGIGANTAIFSVVYGILLKPLPFEQADRLVGVWHTAPGLNMPLLNQGPATYFTYREEGRVFEDIGLWTDNAVAITGRGEPERVRAFMVTDGVLSLLRVQPILGRRFSRADDAPKAAGTVMLTYAYWQRKFGGEPTAIGQSLIVDGAPHQVIGVLPARYKFLTSDPAVLLPLQFDRSAAVIGNFSWQGVARLKAGATVAQANADVARMIPMLIRKFPVPKGFSAKMFDDIRLGPLVRPLADDAIGDVRSVLWIVFATVAMVFLIACANVANLFLVRSEGRHQEMAVRAALGAARGRLAREFLGESLTLSLAGGAVGVGLAAAALRVLVAIAPDGLPRLEEIGIDPIVLAFTLGISILAGVLFGLIPVLRFRFARLSRALNEGGRASSDGREHHLVRNVLVVGEVALSLVLLVGSGLMIRTFVALRSVDPGFTRPEEVLTLRTSVPKALVPEAEDTVRLYDRMVERVAQLPGVQSITTTSSVTMAGNDSNNPVFVEGSSDPVGKMPPIRRFKWVSENYVRTLGNRLVAGRQLTWEDSLTRRNVVMVTENFARLYWKSPQDALGRHLRSVPTSPWYEVVGVVGNERDNGLAQPAPPIVYWPLLIDHFFQEETYVPRSLALLIRSPRLDSPTFLKEIQQAIWSVNPSVPVSSVRTLAAIRAESMAQTSFALVMLGIAAVVALLLGVVGIYGVIASIAAQRTREIGIRVALGAQPHEVRSLFLRHGLLLTSIGLVIGIGAAAAGGRLMSMLLFGVTGTDPLTYAVVSVALLAIALVASYVPARRAARVDPIVALRADA